MDKIETSGSGWKKSRNRENPEGKAHVRGPDCPQEKSGGALRRAMSAELSRLEIPAHIIERILDTPICDKNERKVEGAAVCNSIFPYMRIEEIDQGFKGTVGMKLVSLLDGNLFVSDDSPGAMGAVSSPAAFQEIMARSRESLLHALSGWSRNLQWELHFKASPMELHSGMGNTDITLFLMCYGETRNKVLEDLIVHYLRFNTLVTAHVPEAAFAPVRYGKEFQSRYNSPPAAQNILLVTRAKLELDFASVGGVSLLGGRAGGNLGGSGPIRPWEPSHSGWSRLMAMLASQIHPVSLVVRMRTSWLGKEVEGRVRDALEICDEHLNINKDAIPPLQSPALRMRNTLSQWLSACRRSCFDIGVFVHAHHRSVRYLADAVGDAISARAGRDPQSFLTGGFSVRQCGGRDVTGDRYFPEQAPFTLREAASAFRLPSPPFGELPAIPVRRYRTRPLQLAAPFARKEGEMLLCLNRHKGVARYVYTDGRSRLQHYFIAGQTGTGKSTFMENMILQDIKAGRGVAVIDPHGQLTETLLGKIPPARSSDVVYFDMLDTERPMGLNVLEFKTVEERDAIIDSLYQAIDNEYDLFKTGGPMFEKCFRVMLQMLMTSAKTCEFTPTLLDFTRCFVDKPFRDRLKARTDDPLLLDQIREIEATSGEWAFSNLSPYITSKFSRYINDKRLQRILGQEKTALDFEKIMNSGKIFFARLGKGIVGPKVGKLMMNLIVERFQLAAMKRINLPENERRPFFMYVDECQNLPRENLMEMLSEMRKFGLGLVLSTQYLSQIGALKGRTDSLTSAVLGNAAGMFCFRTGNEDARILESVMAPTFSKMDLINLPNWKGIGRMIYRNELLTPFSFDALKPAGRFKKGIAEKCRNHSRMQYGEIGEKVDACIKRSRSSAL